MMSSFGMEGWIFIIGSPNHFRISSVGVGDSSLDGFGTCYKNLLALQLLWRGTCYTYLLLLWLLLGGTLFETWGVSLSKRVEEKGESRSSLFQETWVKRFISWLMRSRSINFIGISWHRWRKWVEKSSTDFPGVILKRNILSYTYWWSH